MPLSSARMQALAAARALRMAKLGFRQTDWSRYPAAKRIKAKILIRILEDQHRRALDQARYQHGSGAFV